MNNQLFISSQEMLYGYKNGILGYYDVETMDYTYSNYTGQIYSSVYGPDYHIDFTVSDDGKTLTFNIDMTSGTLKRVIL